VPVSRQKFPYLQVADGIAEQISSGELRQGDRLPSLDVIAADWHVSHETAHRAVGLLRSRKLVTTVPRTGSFVGAPRELPGPQQLLAGTRFPGADSVTVTAAEVIPAPEYIVPILGVTPYGPGGTAWVIRREQVSHEVMLMTQWFPGSLADAVPELAGPGSLPPGEAIALIRERTGRRAARWTQSYEARPILDDGREGPLMNLLPGSYVQAITWTWADDRDVIEYGEYILPPGRVTVNEGTVEPDARPGH
jgi:GntR family transcriptional regulator